jgi:YbbR domain-containing protein
MKNSKVYSWFKRNNIGFKLLALLLAFMLWYYVAGQRDPIIEREFTLTAEARGLSSERLLVSPLPQVRVTAKGMRSVIRGLKADDLHAYVEIPDQETGEQLIPIKVDVPSDVEVVAISPERIKVELDVMTEKQAPVRVLVRGETSPGFTYSTPAANPEQVTVKGPGRFLDEITEVQAIVELKGAKNDISRQVTVQLTKNVGEQVTVEPASVQVRIPVVTSGPVKTVALSVVLQGEAAAGFEVKSQSVEPNTLRVTGPAEIIDGLQEIRTQPVDLSGAQENIVKDVEPALPTGVIPLSQTKVKVNIVIGAVEKESEQAPNE